MKKIDVVPAIEYLMREFHGGLLQVMRAKKQTQAEAAEALGISVATFQKMLRLRWPLNFHSNWGQNLSNRMEDWSGVPIDVLFPPAFFSPEFIKRQKTHRKSLPFALLMQGGDPESITLQLNDVSSARTSPDAKPEKKMRKKRRTKKK